VSESDRRPSGEGSSGSRAAKEKGRKDEGDKDRQVTQKRGGARLGESRLGRLDGGRVRTTAGTEVRMVTARKRRGEEVGNRWKMGSGLVMGSQHSF